MSRTDPEAPTLIAAATSAGEQSLEMSATLLSHGAEQRHQGPEEPSQARGSVLGRYVVLDVLGQGGMGVVYAAYDPELERQVALKLVKMSRRDSARTTGSSRLLREAQALAKLAHPNVVGVYDVGTWKDAVFVAMELIEGETLSDWIVRRHAENPPSWREVLALMEPAGRGLEAAHAAGIVHRDFKPDNVMISNTGRVVVLDFGLARASEEGPDTLTSNETGSRITRPPIGGGGSMQLPLTATGSVMGTPAYMSPEQFSAQRSDAISDQFSYCVTVYHALYGERPFRGTTLPELTHAVLTGDIRPAPKGSRVPAWLRAVVLRGLATAAEHRHRSMSELRAALSHDPARRRNRVLVGVALAAAAGGIWWTSGRVASGEDPCITVRSNVEEAWGPSQRAALGEAFRNDAKTYSEQTLSRVSEGLDHYVAQWVPRREAACEASREVGTQSGREAALRAACLDQRLRRVATLVRLLADADQAMVAKAQAAVADLPEPSGCDDAQEYRRTAPVPDDPAGQETVESLRLRRADSQALVATGRLQEALELADGLLTEARAFDFDPVVAEMLLEVGGIQTQMGEFAAALPRLEEAELLARAHGLSRLEANVLSPLIFLHTSYTDELALARWMAREHAALVVRLGDPPRMQSRALVDLARLERRSGNLQASVDLLRRAIELIDDQESAANLIVAYDNLASSLSGLGNYEEASRVLQQAQALAATSLGTAHPHRGNLLVHAARVEDSRGNHERSASLLQTALGLFEGAYGSVHPNISAVHNGLGLQLDTLGQNDQAIEHYERALEIALEVFGDDHLQNAIIQQNLGNLLRRVGRAEEALPLHRKAAVIRQRMDAVSNETLYQLADNLGDDLRVLGRYEQAEAEYRRALQLREADGAHVGAAAAYPRLGLALCSMMQGRTTAAREALEGVAVDLEAASEDDEQPDLLALTRFALAGLLHAAEPGSARAQVLAERAREQWAPEAREFRLQREQLEAWLEHRQLVMPVY